MKRRLFNPGTKKTDKPGQLTGTFTKNVPELLEELNCTMVLSEASGNLSFINGSKKGLVNNLRTLNKPSKLAVSGQRLALITGDNVTVMGHSVNSADNDSSSSFLPRNLYNQKYTTPCDTAFGEKGVWIAEKNGLSINYIGNKNKLLSSVQLNPSRNGHISGMAVRNSEPEFVTLQGVDDRDGFLMHAPTNEIISADFKNPLSPKFFNSSLLLMDGVSGDIFECDPLSGRHESINRFDGIPTAMECFGDYLFTAVSNRYQGTSRIKIINLAAGKSVGTIECGINEISGVTILPGKIVPGTNSEIKNSLKYLNNQNRKTLLKQNLNKPLNYLAKGAAVATIAGTILLSGSVTNSFADIGPFVEKKLENPLAPPIADSFEDIYKTSFVDFDNDGDKDMFLSGSFNKDDLIEYFENISEDSSKPVYVKKAGTENPFYFYKDMDMYSSFPYFSDFDGDGDYDAFVAVEGGEFLFFENTSDATGFSFTKTTESPVELSPVRHTNISFADFDGDGKLDAFSIDQSWNPKLFYYKNSSTDTTPSFTLQDQTATDYPLTGINPVESDTDRTISFVDINNDSNLDAIICNRDSLKYFVNNGETFTEVTGTDNPFNDIESSDKDYDFYSITFSDIDNDTNLDMIINETRAIRYFKHNGNKSAPTFIEVTNEDTSNPFRGIQVGANSSPSFADIDGDGDLDAFIGDSSRVVNYFENTGNKSEPVFVEIETNTGNPVTYTSNPLTGLTDNSRNSTFFADIDKDGDLDAFVGDYYGYIKYFRNDRNSTDSPTPGFVEATDENYFNGIDFGDLSTPSFADINEDGLYDAIIGDSSGDLNYYLNDTDNVTAPAFLPQDGTNNPFNGIDVGSDSAPVFADLDGDGDLDAVVGEYGENINYYKNNGAASGPENQFESVSGTDNPFSSISFDNPYNKPSFADIDGDGDLDLFVGSEYGGISYYKNMNSAPDQIIITSETGLDTIPVSGTTVATFSSIDSDTGDTEFRYTLVEGEGADDNDLFEINGDNLETKGAVDTTKSYFIRVRTKDDDSGYYDQKIALITNNSEPSGISLSSTSINENESAGATVGTFSTSDPDSGDLFTYAFATGTGDSDNSLFTISDGVLIANDSFDYEVKSSYSILVRSTDSGGLYVDEAFTITVNNVSEPTDPDPETSGGSDPASSGGGGGSCFIGTLGSDL